VFPTPAPVHLCTAATISSEVPPFVLVYSLRNVLVWISLTHRYLVLAQANASALAKHSDIHYTANFDKTLTVDFVWAPMVANVTSTLRGKFRTQPGTYSSNPTARVLCRVFHIIGNKWRSIRFCTWTFLMIRGSRGANVCGHCLNFLPGSFCANVHHGADLSVSLL
jgi:hypothetical protein